MEFLLLILCIVTLIMVANIAERSRSLEREVKQLREALKDWSRAMVSGTGTPPKATQDRPQEQRPPIITPPPAAPPKPTPPVPPSPQVIAPVERGVPAAIPTARPMLPSAPKVEEPRRPSFLERNPDLEKFIGENLINKIGIAVLVLGIGLLLRYAIGRGLISETARTLIGLTCGAALLFVGHRLRDKLRAFSSVLVGGGLAVLYSTVAIAHHMYAIGIGQTAAFIIMVGITGVGVLLTLAYDRKELAVIALLGGFLSPFMASNGQGNFVALFTYLLILDTGMLVLANYKRWHIINVIAFVFTALIFYGWHGTQYGAMMPLPIWPAFGFATGFFLVFFGMHLRYNLKHRLAFGALDFSLLLANTAAYYGAGMFVLGDLPVRITGLFTIALGAFHCVFAWLFFRKQEVPRMLVLLLVGLVLTFVSLAGPVQLQGNHITLFWAAEAVLLLWFSQRTGLKLVQRTSVLVLALMLISLSMDLVQLYGPINPLHLPPLLNNAWITGMVAAIALGSYAWLLARLPQEEEVLPGLLSVRLLRPLAWIGCGVVCYLVNLFELAYQLGAVCEPAVVVQALFAYTMFALLVADRLVPLTARMGRSAIGALMVLTLAMFVSTAYHNSRTALAEHLLGTGGAGHVLFHYMAFATAILITYRVTIIAREVLTRPSQEWTLYLWAICALLVVLASQELDQLMLMIAHPTGTRHDVSAALIGLRKAGYPILWGLGSFVFMWYGMRSRQRTVRIIALSLFGVTLVKLFVVDIRGVSEGGKVAAFICLGVLLLVVSFMYNKLKVLVASDEKNETASHVP